MNQAAIALLDLIGQDIEEDWGEASSGFDDPTQFLVLRAQWLSGGLSERVARQPCSYPMSCDPEAFAACKAALSNWTLAHALELEIADPGTSKEAPRL